LTKISRSCVIRLIDALDKLCAQLTRDLFAIAKFLLFFLSDLHIFFHSARVTCRNFNCLPVILRCFTLHIYTSTSITTRIMQLTFLILVVSAIGKYNRRRHRRRRRRTSYIVVVVVLSAIGKYRRRRCRCRRRTSSSSSSSSSSSQSMDSRPLIF